MIFTDEEEMRTSLTRLLQDFPHALLNGAATTDCPWQSIISIETVDCAAFLAWAIATRNLPYCFHLVMNMLEEPQPDWMRPVISQFGNRLLE
jgi:hypothetical protein